MSAALGLAGLPAIPALGLAVGGDDSLNQLVADHVLAAEANEVDVLDTGEDVPDLDQAGASRVRNIFICSGLVFWASSRITKEELSERPRMKASGATSIVPRSK